MMRTNRPTMNRPDLTARLLQMAGRFVVRIWPRLEDLISRGLARAGAALAGDESTTLTKRIKTAARWAKVHDTVSPAVVKKLHRNYEERVERHALQQQQRQERRLKKEAARKERAQRYTEKSSIYLG